MTVRSERKEQAIYNAVHEQVMNLRIGLRRDGADAKLDTRIAQAGHAAGIAAISAYRKPLPRKKGTR